MGEGEGERERITKNASRWMRNLVVAVHVAIINAIVADWGKEPEPEPELEQEQEQEQEHEQEQEQETSRDRDKAREEEKFSCRSPMKFSSSSSSCSRLTSSQERISICSPPELRCKSICKTILPPRVISRSRNKQKPSQPRSFSKSSKSKVSET